MKSFFISTVTIVLLALSCSIAEISVNAAPLNRNQTYGIAAANDRPNPERRAFLHPSAQATINWMSHPTNRARMHAKPFCFYSGRTTRVPAPWSGQDPHFRATLMLEHFMKHPPKCYDITDSIANSQQSSAGWTLRPDWSEVSRAFARYATRDVIVLLGQKIADDSVWKVEELPELLANPSVRVIEQWVIGPRGMVERHSNLKG